MKLRKLAAAAAAGVILLTGCGAEHTAAGTEPARTTVLTIGTADSGGTMYPVGSAIARVLESDSVKVTVSASSGSAMNVKSLTSGEVDLALVAGDTALAAYEDPVGNGAGLRAVGAVFFSQSNWLAPESSGLEWVHELAGLRLGVGPERSTTEFAALAALEGVGLGREDVRPENCSLGTGTEKLARGELDALHGFSGAPIGALSTLAEETPCRVLRYTPEELEAILAAGSIFAPVTLPAGTYGGQTEPVDTFGVKCLLCVDESLDEELVYRLTETLWENRETLAAAHPALAAVTEEGFLSGELPIPLHPGAQRFYDGLS